MMKIILIVNVKSNWRGKKKKSTAVKQEAKRYFFIVVFSTLWFWKGTPSRDFP